MINKVTDQTASTCTGVSCFYSPGGGGGVGGDSLSFPKMFAVTKTNILSQNIFLSKNEPLFCF